MGTPRERHPFPMVCRTLGKSSASDVHNLLHRIWLHLPVFAGTRYVEALRPRSREVDVWAFTIYTNSHSTTKRCQVQPTCLVLPPHYCNVRPLAWELKQSGSNARALVGPNSKNARTIWLRLQEWR